MEQAVQLMAGLSFTILGLSYLFRAREWNGWLIEVEQRGKQASLVFGGISLLLGAFIVAFHPVWEGIPLILTIIGILSLIKGTVYLLFPQWLPTKIKYIHQSERPLLRASGVLFIIIGAVLLNHWCTFENSCPAYLWDII